MTKNQLAGKGASALRKLAPQVSQFLQASLSDNTRSAYSKDLSHFLHWGGRIPATPESVASYLAMHAGQLSFATLSRRVVAIGRAHTIRNLPSPTHAEVVKSTLQGIRRVYGSAQRRVTPVLLRDVQAMVKGLRGLKGLRDRALLLLGFSGAFRRSELVSIRVEDVHFVEQGMVVRLRRGKTDQAGKGRDIAIPYVRGKYCPVKALINWLKHAEITSGAIFREVNRHGNVMGQGLSPQAVATIVKQRAESIGLDSRLYSGHSLRAGMITSAAQSGVSAWKICLQSGHQSEAVMQRYIRESNLFTDNPLGKMW